MIKAVLIHLSRNMWSDRPGKCTDYLVFEEPAWRDLVRQCADSGINTVFLDVGDGLQFKSHPEISCSDAWSHARMKEEIARCRDLGMQVYPKLNFSSAHDTWLKVYSRMLSTPLYYQVCRDLIAETIEVFEGAPHFHIGMDEEDDFNQRLYDYAVIRRGDLWWNDLNFYCDEVRKNGARPWMWSDKLWTCDPAEFAAKVPKDVVQNNWFYWDRTDYAESEKHPPQPETDDFAHPGWHWKIVETFNTLDKLGYDQVPCGSNWGTPKNYNVLVEYCLKNISQDKLAGLMMAPWKATTQEFMPRWQEALAQVREAHQKHGVR